MEPERIMMFRSGFRLRRPVRPATRSARQVALAVDLATVGDRAIHAGQAARGGHPVGRRQLAVE